MFVCEYGKLRFCCDPARRTLPWRTNHQHMTTFKAFREMISQRLTQVCVYLSIIGLILGVVPQVQVFVGIHVSIANGNNSSSYMILLGCTRCMVECTLINIM